MKCPLCNDTGWIGSGDCRESAACWCDAGTEFRQTTSVPATDIVPETERLSSFGDTIRRALNARFP